MQIVMEIDEKLYNYMQTEKYDEHLDKRFDYQIRFAVKDGVPLPKGHGRLIDADALLKDVRDNSESYFADDFAHEWVDVAPTIIEADKSEEHG